MKRGSGDHVIYGLAASRQEVANGSCVLACPTGLAEPVISLRSRENSKCSPGPGEGRENRVFLTAKIPASVAGHAFALTSCFARGQAESLSVHGPRPSSGRRAQSGSRLASSRLLCKWLSSASQPPTRPILDLPAVVLLRRNFYRIQVKTHICIWEHNGVSRRNVRWRACRFCIRQRAG